MFGSSQSSGAPDLIVTSSNSGLQAQEGLDRTAMDIQVFARGGGAEAASGVQNPGAEAEMEDIEVEDSEEGGVSSIVSSSGEQGAGARGPGRARQAITWGDETGANTGTTSSSPQRQAAQVRSLLLTNHSLNFIIRPDRLEGELPEVLRLEEQEEVGPEDCSTEEASDSVYVYFRITCSILCIIIR